MTDNAVNRDDGNRHLDSFFSHLGEHLELVARSEEQLARYTAPRFSLFNAAYIGQEETRITGILRDLLDPNGSHGQGPAFLKSFLETIDFKPALQTDLERAHVRDEHSTDERRRIDLTVRTGGCLLGLENKIYADERVNQVGHYLDFIAADAKGPTFFIFLTPDKDRAPDPKACDPKKWNSLVDQGKARALSYSDLSDWLCLCASCSRPDRVRVLLQDMAEWARNFGGAIVSNFKRDAVKDFVLKHTEHVDAFLAAVDAFEVLKCSLIVAFAERLEAKMRVVFPFPEWTVANNIDDEHVNSGRELSILLSRPTWGYSIGIGAYSADKQFAYGLKREGSPKNEIEKLLKAALGNATDEDDPWFWYRYISPRERAVDLSRWSRTETLRVMYGERQEDTIEYFVALFEGIARKTRPILDNVNISTLPQDR